VAELKRTITLKVDHVEVEAAKIEERIIPLIEGEDASLETEIKA
jgi:hypothetical protein